MTAPKRPSLATAIAHIDDVLADYEPRYGPAPASCARSRHANGVTTHCQIPAVKGTDLCRFHAEPGSLRDADPAEVLTPTGHLPGPPGPTCPGCAARDARPGWLARALNRLFA